MADYEVGFGKPPKGRQFKRGQSGNPNGRPKRKPTPLAEQINAVMDAPMRYREQGEAKVATRRELSLRMLVDRAAKGDVGAAESLLKVRQRAERHGDGGARILRVEHWLPDRPGQTAEEKTEAVRTGRHAEPTQRKSQE